MPREAYLLKLLNNNLKNKKKNTMNLGPSK